MPVGCEPRVEPGGGRHGCRCFPDGHLVIGYVHPVVEPSHEGRDEGPLCAGRAAAVWAVGLKIYVRWGDHVRLEQELLAPLDSLHDLSAEPGFFFQRAEGHVEAFIGVVDLLPDLAPGCLVGVVYIGLQEVPDAGIRLLYVEPHDTDRRSGSVQRLFPDGGIHLCVFAEGHGGVSFLRSLERLDSS